MENMGGAITSSLITESENRMEGMFPDESVVSWKDGGGKEGGEGCRPYMASPPSLLFDSPIPSCPSPPQTQRPCSCTHPDPTQQQSLPHTENTEHLVHVRVWTTSARRRSRDTSWTRSTF